MFNFAGTRMLYAAIAVTFYTAEGALEELPHRGKAKWTPFGKSLKKKRSPLCRNYPGQTLPPGLEDLELPQGPPPGLVQALEHVPSLGACAKALNI